jgi:hypothetical protein
MKSKTKNGKNTTNAYGKPLSISTTTNMAIIAYE